MRNVTILLAVAAMVAVAVPAYGAPLWVGGTTGNWNVDGNWSPSGVPTAASVVVINDGTCTVANTGAVTYDLYLQETGDVGTGGALNMTGGDLDVGYIFYNGYGSGDGYATVSGGSLSIKWYVAGNSTSVGHFTVDGAGADSITMTNYDDENDANSGVLTFIFGGGSDPIQQIDISSTPNFGGTDLVIQGTADAGTYTILTHGTPLSNFQSITVPTGWSYSATSSGVTVTAIPEPATMVLLGIGGIGVLIRRRRR